MTKQPETKCDAEIFKNGQGVYMIAGLPSTAIEAMVVRCREETGLKVDWHYVGGRGVILVVGGVDDQAAVSDWFELHRMIGRKL